MAGRRRRTFSLPAQDRQRLEAMALRLEPESPQWTRLRIVLDYNSFATNAALAESLSSSESLVSKTVNIYLRSGWKALKQKELPGPPSHATPAEIEWVKRLRRSGDKRRKRSQLSYAQIAERVGLHPSTVVRILKRRRAPTE